jgi:23S rRNA (uracil1939-C5)-methyltransferase
MKGMKKQHRKNTPKPKTPNPNRQPAPPPANAEPLTLNLVGMAHGGSAFGRHEGRMIFVPYAIPGEQITARIVQDKGRFANAEGIEVLEPAEGRVYPECPHFGPKRCGGCQWQHIDYAEQLRFKQEVLRDQLARLGGFADPAVLPTIASPTQWEYRTHATFHLDDDGKLGFVTTDNQRIRPIDECLIIRPELQALLEQIDLEALDAPNIKQVRLQVGSKSDDLLIAIYTSDDQEPEVLLDIVASVAFVNAGEESVPLIGTGAVHYEIGGKQFRVTAGSFFQVNLSQAETLTRLVLSYLADSATGRILDLYSGVGLFTAFLAEQATEVVAVEFSPTACDDAAHNLAGLNNVQLLTGTVEAHLAKLTGPFSAAVIDPPRTGMEAEALDALAALGPSRIIYVSCDPATLARDCKRLTSKGYRLVETQPVDMFPQTYHIESVSLLLRD